MIFFLTPEGEKLIFEKENFDCNFSTWVPCFGGFSNTITLPLSRNNDYTDLTNLKHWKRCRACDHLQQQQPKQFAEVQIIADLGGDQESMRV